MYKRDRGATGRTVADDDLPSPRQIIAAHDEIEAEWDLKYTGARVGSPFLHLRKIVQTVAEYDGVYLRAASLLRSITTAHLFEDGNKRTAWVVTRAYLDEHAIEPAPHDEEVERLLRRIRRYDVEEIAEWLESGALDRDRLR